MRNTFEWPALMAAAVLSGGLLAGCGGGGSTSAVSPITQLSSAPLGTLGGPNIALTVTAAGGTLTLPCSGSGQITQPLALDTVGRFDVAGTITTVQGVVLGSGSGTTRTVNARFTGATDGKTMSLTITPAPLGAPAGNAPYTLNYGAAMTDTVGACPN